MSELNNPLENGYGGSRLLDPTRNVLDALRNIDKRQDDLRLAEKERVQEVTLGHERRDEASHHYEGLLRNADNRRIDEQAHLLAEFHEKYAAKESARVDSLFEVSRQEGNKRAADQQQAINTLASQTSALKDSLQQQVAQTALAVEARQAAYASEINKRLSDIERALSVGIGKTSVSDPQSDRNAQLLEQIARAQLLSSGSKEGSDKTWAVVVTAIGITIAAATFFGLKGNSQSSAPQLVYMQPAPATTTPKTP